MKNKNILTEKEKEFLKFLSKYYKVEEIVFTGNSIDFYYCYTCNNASFGYPHKDLKFNKVEVFRSYTLQELGLEE